MIEIQYRTLVWLTYRLSAIFAFGLPLILFCWSFIRKEGSILKLLTIYWKSSVLLAISILLFTGNIKIAFLTSFLAPFFMVGSIWFWIDLNEEINDLPSTRPLPLTFKIWRWSINFWGLLYAFISFQALSCITVVKKLNCNAWYEIPSNFHQKAKVILQFLFGANWSEPLAGFIGYFLLIIFLVGFIQWLLIRLPKQGRVAGDLNMD